jgi:hypothetical protein
MTVPDVSRLSKDRRAHAVSLHRYRFGLIKNKAGLRSWVTAMPRICHMHVPASHTRLPYVFMHVFHV